jgi:sigma-B regulation protein RsbU (phosphoserine phosphatase)
LSDPGSIEPGDGLDRAELFENAPCAYLVVVKGRIVGANGTAAAWFGTTQAELRKMRLYDVLSFGGRMYWETHLSPLLRLQGHIDGVALDFLGPNGSSIPTFASASERRDEDGRVIAVRVVLFRAMERRQYEQALLSARKAADQAMTEERRTAETREQFIAVLGHDLRNPLASIEAGLRMIDRSDDMAKIRSLTKMMQASAGRMSGLIDDVLDFARGRLGSGLALHRQVRGDLEQTIEEVITELRVSKPDREIISELDIRGEVDCDNARIAQMLSNLLANALTHGADDRPVVVNAHKAPEFFEMSVANSGEQIPATVMSDLFKPFVRASSRPSQQGLGLGLYICSEIAKAHGGKLDATSSAEETRFTFRMPLSA